MTFWRQSDRAAVDGPHKWDYVATMTTPAPTNRRPGRPSIGGRRVHLVLGDRHMAYLERVRSLTGMGLSEALRTVLDVLEASEAGADAGHSKRCPHDRC